MALRIRDFQAAGYRSLRSIRVPVGELSVFLGSNGAGKTNLYRALQLLQASAAGALSQELAGEGGMQSALWAGERVPGNGAAVTLSADFGEARDRIRIGWINSPLEDEPGHGPIHRAGVHVDVA